MKKKRSARGVKQYSSLVNSNNDDNKKKKKLMLSETAEFKSIEALAAAYSLVLSRR
jgi:hypothetical protein